MTNSVPQVAVDPAALKANFASVATHGDDVAMYFYSYLFLTRPEVRPMFPLAMTEQRDRLLGALVRIVTHIDRLAEIEPYLADLGRDHRKFGTLTDHYSGRGSGAARHPGPLLRPGLDRHAGGELVRGLRRGGRHHDPGR